jgi:hypothetical protein
MHPLAVSVPTLAVSAIYLIWQAYHAARLRYERLLQERLLRGRVACLLWEAADLPDPARPTGGCCAPGAPTPLWLPRCSILVLPTPQRSCRA